MLILVLVGIVTYFIIKPKMLLKTIREGIKLCDEMQLKEIIKLISFDNEKTKN